MNRSFDRKQAAQIRAEYATPCPTCGKYPRMRELAQRWKTTMPTISHVVGRVRGYEDIGVPNREETSLG